MSDSSDHKPTRLYRSADNRIIGGVCGGLAEYFQWDATLVRLVFILLAFSGGIGIALYLVLWILMPGQSSGAHFASEAAIVANVAELREQGERLNQRVRAEKTATDGERLVGIILVVIGAIFLLQNIGIGIWEFLGKLWPIALIVLGIVLVIRRSKE